jgi:hypothetical protein
MARFQEFGQFANSDDQALASRDIIMAIAAANGLLASNGIARGTPS